ncbi:MAG: DoxX family protein [Bacteroidetes bacterium]|nr:DoxX family protein [Bacteroidota bacterium]
MKNFRAIYDEAKDDKWFKGFAVFCRIFLAVSFIPTGIVKVLGQRFAEGLPHNNPLGHYFDALLLTRYYYTFIGVSQLVIAVLLLIPRTALLGAVGFFAMIVNITVLTYATRFDGTRLITMGLLACLYLLIWDYDRLKYLFVKPVAAAASVGAAAPVISKPLGKRLRVYFFGGCVAVLVFIIWGTFYLFEIVPGNDEEECRNQCGGDKNPNACQTFCDCIYKQGQPLDSALATYHRAKGGH